LGCHRLRVDTATADMNILIDTNIVISLEPTRPDDLELGARVATELVRLVGVGGHRIFIHPESLRELAGDKDPRRRAMRGTLLGKYHQLDPPPLMAPELGEIIGEVDPASHDQVDYLMLSAVLAAAVEFLVTGDGGILSKASRLGIGDRVLTVEDAVAFLESLEGRTPQPPPAVILTKAYTLDQTDPILDSFREDYGAEFDGWLTKCKLEQRPTWVIRDRERSFLSAVCIIKKLDDELRLGGPTLKICSLKVADERQGRRYGELLLKTLFLYLFENRYHYAFVTVFERHAELIALLEDFGFRRHEPDTGLGERVYVKALHASATERDAIGPLEYHVRFGPPALKLVEDRVFLVPIQPRYHKLLFPDAEPPPEPEAQLRLPLDLVPLEPRPFGNALRKAYLSNSPSRQLVPGATLLFYRSGDHQGVTCIGVVEQTLVSRDPVGVAAFVGQRTVYSLGDITGLCGRGEVVAVLFRQDRLLPTPLASDELVFKGVARRAPQSISRVPPEVIPWLSHRIGG